MKASSCSAFPIQLCPEVGVVLVLCLCLYLFCFGFLSVNSQIKPFPFSQLKLSFPSEAFCLQWMENEALFLRLNLGHTSERVCTGCPLASEQAGSPRCPDGSPDSPACLTLGIC